MQPFAQAYYAHYPQSRGKVSVAKPSVQSGSTAGYQVADVVMADAHSLFYEKSGQWHYVGSTQSGQLNCKDYAVQDARLAYQGTACFTDDGQQSTVQ